MYLALPPVFPGTSLSWTPPSSLYCIHRSVSMISAAERNLRIAASPLLSLFLSSWAESRAPTVAVPAASPVLMNERRVDGLFEPLTRGKFPGVNISCSFLLHHCSVCTSGCDQLTVAGRKTRHLYLPPYRPCFFYPHSRRHPHV